LAPQDHRSIAAPQATQKQEREEKKKKKKKIDAHQGSFYNDPIKGAKKG
jgi:hypothetical protein